jgi:hypothetical protein
MPNLGDPHDEVRFPGRGTISPVMSLYGVL